VAGTFAGVPQGCWGCLLAGLRGVQRGTHTRGATHSPQKGLELPPAAERRPGNPNNPPADVRTACRRPVATGPPAAGTFPSYIPTGHVPRPRTANAILCSRNVAHGRFLLAFSKNRLAAIQTILLARTRTVDFAKVFTKSPGGPEKQSGQKRQSSYGTWANSHRIPQPHPLVAAAEEAGPGVRWTVAAATAAAAGTPGGVAHRNHHTTGGNCWTPAPAPTVAGGYGGCVRFSAPARTFLLLFSYTHRAHTTPPNRKCDSAFPGPRARTFFVSVFKNSTHHHTNHSPGARTHGGLRENFHQVPRWVIFT
jgi:hypothetical protein